MCDHIYAIADNNAYGRARPASRGDDSDGGGGSVSGGRCGAEEVQEQEREQEENERRRKITDKALEEARERESFVGAKAEKTNY